MIHIYCKSRNAMNIQKQGITRIDERSFYGFMILATTNLDKINWIKEKNKLSNNPARMK